MIPSVWTVRRRQVFLVRKRLEWAHVCCKKPYFLRRKNHGMVNRDVKDSWASNVWNKISEAILKCAWKVCSPVLYVYRPAQINVSYLGEPCPCWTWVYNVLHKHHPPFHRFIFIHCQQISWNFTMYHSFEGWRSVSGPSCRGTRTSKLLHWYSSACLTEGNLKVAMAAQMLFSTNT